MKQPLLGKFFLASFGLVIILLVNGCSKTASSDSSATIADITSDGLISNLTSTTAQSGGIITYNGGADITASGVCYSATNPTPTTADSKTTDVGTIDAAGKTSFVSSLTGLTASTAYYLRAYATNSAGTAYGSVVKFTTSATISSVVATVSTFAGSGAAGYQGGSGTAALFDNPQGVAADALGNVFVADGFNNRIREISPLGLVSSYAGDGNAGYREGAIATAEFYGPQGIAIDASGNMYVADIGNNVIRKISAAGVVSTLAGNGTKGYVNGVDTVAEFNTPQGIAVDASGNVYVADRGNNMIRKITPAGVVSTLAGTGLAGYLDGAGTTVAEFNIPKSVAVDASGNVYVADLGNYAIRKITSAGVVSTVAGSNVQATIIGAPAGLAIDAKGNLFVTDQNGRVLEITASNVLYVLAGNPKLSGYVDGTNANVRFNSPQGITVDSNGNIYVADFNNNVIRKIVVAFN